MDFEEFFSKLIEKLKDNEYKVEFETLPVFSYFKTLQILDQATCKNRQSLINMMMDDHAIMENQLEEINRVTEEKLKK